MKESPRAFSPQRPPELEDDRPTNEPASQGSATEAPVKSEDAEDRNTDALRTDHLQSDLQSRSVTGGLYMVASQAGKFVLKLGSTIFLARLLTPEDFGLVAMASAITGFMVIFKDLGLSMATIQREHITHAQVTGLFWVNVGVSAVLAIAAAASAPLVAWFYGDPRLTGITVALSVGFILGGLTTQHEAILKRQMRFRVLAGLEVAAILVGASVAVVYAFLGGGYWSLVLLNLMHPVVLFVGVWIFCQWRPSGPRKGRDLKDLLSFGGNLTGFNVINYFSRRGDDILIGRFVGAGALGLYQKAYQLLLFPLRQLNTPLTSVMIPTLSRTVQEPEKHRRIFTRTVEAISILTMPMVAFMMMTSDWLVLLVLGPKWTAAAELFALLGIVGLVQPVSNATGWLFISQDRSREKLQWGGIGGTLVVLSFVAGLPWGAVGVAASYGISGLVLRVPLLFWMVGRRGPVRTRDLYRLLLLPGIATVSVFASLGLIRLSSPSLSGIAGLAAGLLVVAVVFVGVYLLSPSTRSSLHLLYQKAFKRS